MSKQTEMFYNRFLFFYPLIDFFLKPQKQRLFEEVNSLPFGNLLEIGVGNGAHLPLYKAHRIIGIDTSSGMLEKAMKKLNANISLIQMNGEELQFCDCCFDYVVLSHIIAVVDDPEKLLQEVHRVLKKGGELFILNHFTPENWLRYIDEIFNPISSMLHFKSLFSINSLKAIEKFRLQQQIDFGRFAYFKLLIFCKA